MTDPAPGPDDREARDRGVTPSQRQRVVEVLCDAYAEDRLGMMELERRLDRAHRANTDEELAAILADLDTSRLDSFGMTTLERGRSLSGPSGEERARGGAPAAPGSVARIEEARVPERQLTIAFWSARARRGTWVPARRISAIAIQGGVELDFRGALFGPGVTEVRAVAFMGAVDIIVPPELHLDTRGFAVLGTFEDEAGSSSLPSPDGPVLRLTGFALLGAVDVQVRLPGESERQARIRRRRERSTNL